MIIFFDLAITNIAHLLLLIQMSHDKIVMCLIEEGHFLNVIGIDAIAQIQYLYDSIDAVTKDKCIQFVEGSAHAHSTVQRVVGLIQCVLQCVQSACQL